MSSEIEDRTVVEQALTLLSKGDLERAEAMLRAVVANTPADYADEYVRDDQRVIKFWSQNEFVYHCTRKRAQPLMEKILWEPNVYPRAYYHLGFICVKQGKPEEALRWLKAGVKLGDHPMFWLEQGRALTMLKQFDEALRHYDHVASAGEEVSAPLRAVAIRGKGFVLIEEGQLDAAEAAFQLSLTLDPDSGVARNELAYIAQLRSGGRRGPSQTVATGMDNSLLCFRCGTKDLDGGKVVTIQGRLIACCKRCHGKLTKKWWQFWK